MYVKAEITVDMQSPLWQYPTASILAKESLCYSDDLHRKAKAAQETVDVE